MAAIVMAMTPAFMAIVVAMHAHFAMHAMFPALIAMHAMLAPLMASCAIMIAVADPNIDIGLGELDAIRRRTGGERRRAGGKTRSRESKGDRSGQRESKRFHVDSSFGGRRTVRPLSFAPTTQEGPRRSAEILLSH
jgi:hypothetical protein